MAKKIDNPKRKVIVVAFGRFNPPSSGHQLLINTVMDIASKQGADHAMFSSRTGDAKKNPLSAGKKFNWLKKIFPKANFVNERSILTPVDMLSYLAQTGYTDVVMVGGEDRATMYKGFNKFTKPNASFKIPLKSVTFKQAGERRDPNAKGVVGMSGSKLRQAAADNKFKVFSLGLPSTISKMDAKGLFDEVRKGMKLEEEAEYRAIFQSTAKRIVESNEYLLGEKISGWLSYNWRSNNV